MASRFKPNQVNRLFGIDFVPQGDKPVSQPKPDKKPDRVRRTVLTGTGLRRPEANSKDLLGS